MKIGDEAAPGGLTERQQYWLDHITRCDAGGGHSTKDYAAAHDLSVQAMYSARRDLVERGALVHGGRGVRAASRSRFSRAVPLECDAGVAAGTGSRFCIGSAAASASGRSAWKKIASTGHDGGAMRGSH